MRDERDEGKRGKRDGGMRGTIPVGEDVERVRICGDGAPLEGLEQPTK